MPSRTKPIPQLTAEEAERFWSKIDRRGEDDRWEWRRSTNNKGYGRIRIRRQCYLAHRLAYALTLGDPGEMVVCHTCDNPLCCNPRHHWLGTQAENAADMVAKGLSASAENHSQAKLTAAAIQVIRESRDYHRNIARQHGISLTAVHLIKSGAHWSHTGDPTRTVQLPCVGVRRPNAKVNDDIVRAIRSSYASNQELAGQYGIDASVVSRIRHRKAWRHVA